MSRILQGFRALLASPAVSTSSSATAAAKFSSASAAAAKPAATKVSRKPKKPTTSKPKADKPAAPRTTNRPTGISKVTPVSPALGQFLGAQQASRTEAVKQIWTYIKSHNLQVVFGEGMMFFPEFQQREMDGETERSQMRKDKYGRMVENWCKTDKPLCTAENDNPVFTQSHDFYVDDRVSFSAGLYFAQISYNPSNKREIFCDEKLKAIFYGKEKIGFLEIGKLLTGHFVKTD
ncbi:SWIB/MDM2 domain - like 10 [Theobroma cacao]|uniref:SWIB domain-containing protein n=1 Tax=Theobroma cacao TaxID=3641 RepID=A0A061EZ43_THECC|nr:Uncharacterized protein TCM_025735 [Theobroma cacao]WRX23383.1 SWIB/MDM2 domain - like 10 [Theobroma cacao]